MNNRKISFLKKIKFLLYLPKSLPLVWRLLQDRRLPFKNKLIFVGISLVYLIIPFDLIPDVPLIGHVDDFAIFLFMLNWFLSQIPENILKDYGWKS